jgi:hypothetical protein
MDSMQVDSVVRKLHVERFAIRMLDLNPESRLFRRALNPTIVDQAPNRRQLQLGEVRPET